MDGITTFITLFPLVFGLLLAAYLGIKVGSELGKNRINEEMQQIAMFKKNLSNEERLQFDLQFASHKKNPVTALVLGLLLGGLGIDRFYIGHVGLGVLKLVTLGGLLIWASLDWFLIMEATRRRNRLVAQQIRDSLIQLRPASETMPHSTSQ